MAKAKQPTKKQLEETVDKQSWQLELFQERLAELELALEDADWLKLTIEGDREFSREGLRKIAMNARMMYLKNPLIRRSVTVQTHYVWAQGVNIQARDKKINEVVQQFLSDPDNKKAMFGHRARISKEVSLQIEGNMFFAFFINKSNGRVRIRSFPAAEIDEIITNPEDREDVWFYRRSYDIVTLDDRGQRQFKKTNKLYPDWQHRPKAKPPKMFGMKVEWDTPIMQVKSSSLDDMLWGVPDVYASLDWAKAYKNFLEDWASIVRSLQRFAWRLSTKGGKKGVADAKTKLQTTWSTDRDEDNPPPLAGSTFIAGENVDLQAMPKTGATVEADDGRMLRLMVASGTGIPDTMLSGDSDTGNLATAKTLDRPTELAMRDRQSLWAEVLQDMCNFAVEWSVRAPGGKLKGKINEKEGVRIVEVSGSDDTTVDVIFPPILEHDLKPQIESIVAAAGLKVMPTRVVAKLVMTALGVNEVDELIDELFPDGTDPMVDLAMPSEEEDAVADQMNEVVRDIQRFLKENAREPATA